MKAATYTTWNSLRDFDALANRLLAGSVTGCGSSCATAPGSDATRTYSPPVDVTEDSASYILSVDLPDAQKEGLKVTVENNVLTLLAERKTPERPEGVKALITERVFGTFARSFRLPEDADGSGVAAAYKDGVLTISVPKRAESQPKVINVAVE